MDVFLKKRLIVRGNHLGSKHFICEDNKINVECEEPVIKDFMDRGIQYFM